MQRRVPAFLALAGTVAAGGCASKASMDARYQASLLRWQGATRAELEASWGKPTLVLLAADGQVLTWIVRMDIDQGTPGTPPIVAVARTGGGTTGPTTVSIVNPGALAPAQVPITCTTHFVLKDGRVASWTFDGLGCGAPT